MSTYADACRKLETALKSVKPDGPEWIKTKAAIVALEEAQSAEVSRDFINATRRLDDAAAKLKSLIGGKVRGRGSRFVSGVRGALRLLHPTEKNVEALLSGEPASALPDMPESNKPSFPKADTPSIAPIREFARDIAEADTACGGTAAVDSMIEDILRREGGFVDHPNDRGGPTNFGITLRTLSAWRKCEITRDDVRRMTQEEARAIYTSRYFVGPKIDKLPAAVQPLVFDMSINHGPGTAIKLLQEVLNGVCPPCAVDGGIGNETTGCAKKALQKLGATALVNKLVDRRVALFNAIVANDASQAVFLKGWLRRAEEFRA